MSARNIARILGVAVAVAWAMSALVDTRHASAGPCPDIEVVSARGTDEPPGVGSNDQAFIDSLRSKVFGRSIAVYAVNYPARSLGGAHPPAISPLYRPKTIDLCIPDDPICSEGKNEAAHHLYIDSGMTIQAATFVAGKL